MWEILAVLLIIAIGAGLLAPRVFRQRPGSDWLSGTLLITGVSPRPDAVGEQYVTITGVIDGPTVSDFTVYQRMTADVDRWPAMGELRPVVYSQRNPEKWAFAPAEPPRPAEPTEPHEPPETPPTAE
ncbi:hypothetical protein [Mycobacterium paraterrae]|uniref:DUF4131 domain-containing protein n=1 Tax=Mycobacterium paraterrae TaxID=577492 RepID=A0ABY3VG07_9MYCO|nr:hypothetical protein [Mycobacterium paraterrae]UMB68218.1 hypothetical protein MKK62_17455 [Mycobacterium paraterrae]